MCIVRSFHEFHNNVVIRATYAHILPNEKYLKYRVIIASKPKISCNIVWTLKKYIIVHNGIHGCVSWYSTRGQPPDTSWQKRLRGVSNITHFLSIVFVLGSYLYLFFMLLTCKEIIELEDLSRSVPSKDLTVIRKRWSMRLKLSRGEALST